MKKLTQTGKSQLRRNNHYLGKMMDTFDKREKTILAWIEDDDLRLQTPPAMKILNEAGLSLDELFVEETTEVPQS